MKLFIHTPHPHQPQNVNDLHAQEAAGLNDKIAVFLTSVVGSMPTAYAFVILAFIGLVAILGFLSPVIALLVAWTSQTLIQLVLLPVIMVGQNVLSRKTEMQADEQYKFVTKSYHDIEQIIEHLSKQDDELIVQTKMLQDLLVPQRKQSTNDQK